MIISPKTESIQPNVTNASTFDNSGAVYICNTTVQPRWIHVVTNDFTLDSGTGIGGGVGIHRIQVAKVDGAVTNSTTFDFKEMGSANRDSIIHDFSNSTDPYGLRLITLGVGLNDFALVTNFSAGSTGKGTITLNKSVTMLDEAKLFLGVTTGYHVGSICVPAKENIIINKETTDKVFGSPGQTLISGNPDTALGLFMTGIE